MTYLMADWQAGTPASEGWDCADAIEDGWTADDLLAFMRATAPLDAAGRPGGG